MLLLRGLGWVGVVLMAWAVHGAGTAVASGDRSYELVSPTYKAGYRVWGIDAVASDGESAVFTSFGAFSGDPEDTILTNSYIAQRSDIGWHTLPLSAPASEWPAAVTRDYSVDLSLSLVVAQPSPSYGVTSTIREAEFLTHDTKLPDVVSNFQVIGKLKPTHEREKEFILHYETATPDFSHVIFESPEELLPKVKGTQVYELSKSEPYLIDLNNKNRPISPACPVEAVGDELGRGSWLNAVSSDGSEIFFESGVSNGECITHEQVFVRLGASRTVEVSRPLDPVAKFGGCIGELVHIEGEVPCLGASSRNHAEFEGASEDGSRVFFLTSEPLTGTDMDTGSDIYMARIECAGGGLSGCEPATREVTGLTQVSHGREAANVQEVVAIAQDGSRVYFVAKGALSGSNAEGRTPVSGADNLYVADTADGKGPSFIGELCSGAETSGDIRDAMCPVNKAASDRSLLWEAATHEAQTNECQQRALGCEEGRYLVFLTYARLTPDDTDESADIYRYDSATGALTRISAGEDGYDANGNGAGNAVLSEASEHGTTTRQHGLDSRATSEDGSHVVFSTGAPLSPAAVNGMENVYEWSEAPGRGGGNVTLVSQGDAEGNSYKPVISSSGRDVFFLTAQKLVSEDDDEQVDLYDARVGGGFSVPSMEVEPCAGDACQGPLSSPTSILVPPTETQIPGETHRPRVARRHHKSHAAHRHRNVRRHRHRTAKGKGS